MCVSQKSNAHEALSVLSVIASSKPGSGPWSAGTIVYDVPFCSLMVGFNVAMALAIVARMLFLRRRVVQSFGTENGKIYTSVAAMFIESASIYAIIGILLIIAYARKSNTQNLILPSLGQAVVRGTLVLYSNHLSAVLTPVLSVLHQISSYSGLHMGELGLAKQF